MIKYKDKKIIGGESELREDGFFSYITDSGRSSLRLILSCGLSNKRFLIPDFLCGVILDIFKEFRVNYSFYKIKEDLTIDSESLKGKRFDVLYLINYFGQRRDVSRNIPRDVTVIEDSVFLPVLEKPEKIKNWIGFNSFRKMSHLSDGSIIKATLKLPNSMVQKKDAPFSEIKREAKRIKYEYIFRNKYSENSYLSLFNKAEKMIEKQKRIYSISARSLSQLFEFYRNLNIEYSIRKMNYFTLDKYLKRFSINLTTDYYSFYVLLVNQRDDLRKHLFSKRIFLPVYWPKGGESKNKLYDNIISIPVDSRYSKNDMVKIARLIHGFYRRA